MNYLAPILILAAIAAVTVFFLWRKKKKKVEEAWKWGAIDRSVDLIKSRAADVLTPGGIALWFEAGLDHNIDLASADAGFDNMLSKLGCAGYSVDRSTFRPKIAVLASILSPESHTPSYKEFIAPGNYYYGSEFDMERGKGEEVDHYVLAAGQMVAVGDPLGDVIAIAHPQGNSQFTKDIVDFENEHLGFAHHDANKFEETKTHGIGRGHPIMDSCPAPAGLYAQPAHEPLASDVVCLTGKVLGETPAMRRFREGK